MWNQLGALYVYGILSDPVSNEDESPQIQQSKVASDTANSTPFLTPEV